jgi:hypothetical protein
LGAKRVVLLGFECKIEGENTHWHTDYEVRRDGEKIVDPYHNYLKHWKQIARDAKECKLEILNATPDTAITEVPQVRFEDTL